MNGKAVLIVLLGFALIIGANIVLISCANDSKITDELDPVCFNTQVLPIIQTSCALSFCHSGSNAEFILNDYNTVRQRVVPGDARQSELYKVISTHRSFEMMPPDRPLTKDQRTIIMLWIEQGALNTICNGDTLITENPDSVCFVQEIQPLLVSNCALSGCHDATSAKDGYVFTDYNSIMNGKKSVVPYQPEKSEMYEVLLEDGDDRMPPPPKSALTAGQIEKIRKWIADGALNSDCPSTTCDTSGAISYAATVFPIIDYACVGCHNSSIQNGNVNLSDYQHISAVALQTVNGISLLSGVIKGNAGFVKMPPSGGLSECETRQIELWVEQGSQNN